MRVFISGKYPSRSMLENSKPVVHMDENIQMEQIGSVICKSRSFLLNQNALNLNTMFGHGKNMLSIQSVITPLSLQTNNGHKRFLKYWLYRSLFVSSFSPERSCQTEVLKMMTLMMWFLLWCFYLYDTFTHAPADLPITCCCCVWVLSNVSHLQFCQQNRERLKSF